MQALARRCFLIQMTRDQIRGGSTEGVVRPRRTRPQPPREQTPEEIYNSLSVFDVAAD